MKQADLSRLVLAGLLAAQLAGCAPDPIKEAPAQAQATPVQTAARAKPAPILGSLGKCSDRQVAM